MIVSPYELTYMIKDWDPPARPYCSNCLHAKVAGTAEAPIVTCAKGYGKPLPLPVMIRKRQARQFTPAVNCADWTDMGPVCNVNWP